MEDISWMHCIKITELLDLSNMMCKKPNILIFDLDIFKLPFGENIVFFVNQEKQSP